MTALALSLLLVGAGAIVTLSPATAVAQEDLAAAQERANKAARELSNAEVEIATAERAVNAVKERAAEVEVRVRALRDQVGQLAVRRYVDGTKPLSRLFGLADANEVVRAQQFAQIVAGSASDSVGRFRAERDDLQEQRGALERQQKEQAGSVENLRKRRAEAVSKVQQLARLAREQQAKAAREAEQKQAKAAAVQSSGAAPAPAAAKAAAPPAAAPVVASGGWTCPVAGPNAFSNDYGAPRAGGRSHQGNDILAERGTPVVANVSGVVTQRSGGIGGIAYFLNGDDGTTYYGAHMDSSGASGQVSAGTVIGTVGNTGDAQGGPTHLHFEMHPGGGGPVNPYSTLRKYC